MLLDELDHLSRLRHPALPRVFADDLLVGREIDAVNLVARDVALHPLDLRAELVQDAAGFLRDPLELFRR